MAPGRPNVPLEHVTPYDRFAWTDIEVERLLSAGEQQRELIAYFGAREYAELRRLAQQAARTPSIPDTRVLVVPGIMGSQLGMRREAPLPNDVLWVDPIDIELGRLACLRLPAAGAAAVISLGPVLYSYLRVKLHLRAAGFSAAFHDYDWRLGIDELGRALAKRVLADDAHSMMIVAHSMGGLVSRAALAAPGMDKVRRVVMLGTPHFGSFAPVQALRGTYAVVRKIARLVRTSTAEAMAAEVFTTFPSLYHMLPVADRNGGPDLFQPSEWPASDPRPDPALLATTQAVRDGLAPPDARFVTIVGVGQETVTAVARRKDEFEYTITRHGDGTVPSVSAELPGALTHYAQVAHSDLTRDPVVAAAVIDLLRKGTTRRLPARWAGRSRAEARIRDSQLRRTHVEKVDWAHMEPEARRVFLQNLNEPPQLTLRVPASSPRGSSRAPESAGAALGGRSSGRRSAPRVVRRVKSTRK
jgi:pimeloyl-ACP methyl ester carboxylesterase